MSCILRIKGEKVDIDTLLSQVSISPTKIWRKGEKRFITIKESERFRYSGANFVVSDANFDEFEQQKIDTCTFLQKHHQDLTVIVSHDEVERADLDFGIYRRDVPVQCDYFEPELLLLCGSLGIGIALSQYPNEDNDECYEE